MSLDFCGVEGTVTAAEDDDRGRGLPRWCKGQHGHGRGRPRCRGDQVRRQERLHGGRGGRRGRRRGHDRDGLFLPGHEKPACVSDAMGKQGKRDRHGRNLVGSLPTVVAREQDVLADARADVVLVRAVACGPPGYPSNIQEYRDSRPVPGRTAPPMSPVSATTRTASRSRAAKMRA